MSALVLIPKWQCTCATTSTTMMSLLQWSKLDTLLINYHFALNTVYSYCIHTEGAMAYPCLNLFDHEIV